MIANSFFWKREYKDTDLVSRKSLPQGAIKTVGLHIQGLIYLKGSSLLLALITESMYCVILPVTYSFSIGYS